MPQKPIFISILATALLLLVASVTEAQVCGNALLETGETCDDGNGTSGDGCSATCQVEAGYECTDPVPPQPLDAVDDGGFEGGTPNAHWSESSILFGTPLCDVNDPACDPPPGSSGPRTGDWWAWFGGAESTETASLEQSLTIEPTDALLTFWVTAPSCDTASDYLRLNIDGIEVFRLEGDDTLCGTTGYVQEVVDLATANGGPYNDGGSHTLRFEAQTFAAGTGLSSFFLDDVSIDRGTSDPVPSECTAFDSCFNEDFDPGTGALPASWTVFEQAPQNHDWGTTDDGLCGTGANGEIGNFTGGSGVAACADSDAAGNTMDAYLCTEAIDLTSADGSRLQFKYSYQVFQASGADIFDVLAGQSSPSPQNIDTYTRIFATGGVSQGTSYATPGASETLDLGAFEGAPAHLCFRYGADNDYYAQIDDVEVRADTCDGSPPPVPPGVPQDVTASDATFEDRVRVTWTDVVDETSYRVFRCGNSSDSGTCSQIDQTAGNVTSFDDFGADAGGAVHYYRIRACNAAGCSDYSEADPGNRLFIPPPPDTPANLAATDGTFTDRVAVTWNDVANEDAFEILRCLDGTSLSSCIQLASVPADTTGYDDYLAAANGAAAHYRVRACLVGSGCSAASAADAGSRLEFCGDGILGLAESCDDGNGASGDGCSAACQVESGYECTLPTAPEPIDGIADGGFEAGAPNPDWIESSDNFGTPLCSIAFGCTSPPSGGPRAGEWWAWFGGIDVPETASLEQTLNLASSDRELSFWLKATACDGLADHLRVTIDGNEVFRFSGDDRACGATNYGRETIDLALAPGGPYNDNASHVLRFETDTTAANGEASSFFVDDVLVFRGETAPVPSVCTAFESCVEEDFDPGTGGLPVGWTTFEDAPQAHTWGTTDDGVCGSGPSGDPANVTGGAGVAACVDSDAAGGLVDAYLCSPSIDLTTAIGSRLRFLYNYQFFQAGADDIFDLLVGTEAPGLGTISGYTTVFGSGGINQGTTYGLPGAEESIDLSAFQGSSIHACFRYGANDDFYAQVDDVEVRAADCDSAGSPPPPAETSASDGLFDDRVQVQWSDVAGEDTFQVFRCADTSTSFCSLIDTAAANVTTYDDFGASADGTVHYYRIKACNGHGCSDYSAYDAGHRLPVDCYTLGLSHSGAGADPTPSPAHSAVCDGGGYVAGEVIGLSANPDPGWAVDVWTGADNPARGSTGNTLTMPATNHAVSVAYIEETATAGQALFVPIEPCRIIDTRQVGGVFGGGTTRHYRVWGDGLDTLQGGAFGCNVPGTATAVQLNFTAVNPSGFGYLRAWPYDLSEPTATLMAYGAGPGISNSVSLAICNDCASDISIKLYGAATHLAVEVVGYYQSKTP